MPFEGVYPWWPSLIAFIAASWIFIGVGKSGWPIPRLIIFFPSAASLLALANIAKADSVSKSRILFESDVILI